MERPLAVLRVVLQELEPELRALVKLPVQQAQQGLAKRLGELFSAVRAEQREALQLAPGRVRWQERAPSLDMKLCRGVWGGARKAKRPEAASRARSRVAMCRVTEMSMDKVAFRRAKGRSSLAMKAKVKICGEAGTVIPGLAAEMAEEEGGWEAQKAVVEGSLLGS